MSQGTDFSEFFLKRALTFQNFLTQLEGRDSLRRLPREIKGALSRRRPQVRRMRRLQHDALRK